MDRYYKSGDRFCVAEKSGYFEIKETVGRGASCVVYRAEFFDEHGNCTEHLLKEYNPKQVELWREESGELCLDSEDDEEVFQVGMARFVAGYEKQMNIRKMSGLKNSTSNVQGIYYANGTQYIDMTCFQGLTYDKVQEETLYNLLCRMKALTQVLANYHKAGFLHLDVKPENLYTIPETCEMVMLFDFDSVLEKDKISESFMLSYTKSWAAPEQLLPGKRRTICEATDLFAVGEIIFYQLMGRHSTTEEHRSFADYEFDCDADIFRNVNPKVFTLLSELLRRTICGVVKQRYASAEELIEKLDELLVLANPKEPYLMSSLPKKQSFFVGRDTEMAEIHRCLQEKDVLFLSGVGGIGKSELAKQYAHFYKSEYDVIVFAPYVTDIRNLLMDDEAVPVYSFAPYPEEQSSDYCVRKLRKLKELCDERTLFIVDNLDREDDSELTDLFTLNCKLLITTRRDFSSDYRYEQMTVEGLKDRGSIDEVFLHYYTKSLSEEERHFISEIIDFVNGHTMTVELLAKQMMAGRVKPKDMLVKLQNHGIKESGKEKIRTEKDGALLACSAYDHVRMLFDLSKLDENEQSILANLSLIPYTGISAELFYEWCELENYDCLNELVISGWVRLDKEKDYISLHPVVGEIAFDSAKSHEMQLGGLLTNSVAYIKGSAFEEAKADKRKAIADLLHGIAMQVVRLDVDTEEVADFLDESPEAYIGFGYLEDAIMCRERALEIIGKLYGEIHEKIAILNNKIANIYLLQEKLVKAEEYYFKAINVWEKLYESNAHEELLDLYADIACFYQIQCDWSMAERYYLKALSLTQNISGRQREIAIFYNNLGIFYAELTEYEKAEECYLEALGIRESLSATMCAENGDTYNNLSELYRECNEFTKAEEYALKALELRRDLYGEFHSAVANSYNSLGVLYSGLGELARAAGYCEKAIEIYRKIYGDIHGRTATSFVNMAYIYKELGDINKAEEYCLNALDIRRNLYGEKHIDTAETYNCLAYLYSEQKLYSKAESFYLKTLEIFHALYENSHGNFAMIYGNLGCLYDEMENFSKAEEYYVKALKVSIEIHGINHTVTALIYNNLGFLYEKQEEISRAKECYQKALDIRQKFSDVIDRESSDLYANLGRIYLKCGDFSEAKSFLQEAMRIRHALYGEYHAKTAESYYSFGDMYKKSGEWLDSLMNYEKARDIFGTLYGEDFSKTIEAQKQVEELKRIIGAQIGDVEV